MRLKYIEGYGVTYVYVHDNDGGGYGDYHPRYNGANGAQNGHITVTYRRRPQQIEQILCKSTDLRLQIDHENNGVLTGFILQIDKLTNSLPN